MFWIFIEQSRMFQIYLEYSLCFQNYVSCFEVLQPLCFGSKEQSRTFFFLPEHSRKKSLEFSDGVCQSSQPVGTLFHIASSYWSVAAALLPLVNRSLPKHRRILELSDGVRQSGLCSLSPPPIGQLEQPSSYWSIGAFPSSCIFRIKARCTYLL